MSDSESPAPIYLFIFAILSRLSARYFIRAYFLRASGFWKLRVNFVWQLGPTAQPPAALQHLSAHRRGCRKGKLPLVLGQHFSPQLWPRKKSSALPCSLPSPFVLSSYVLSSPHQLLFHLPFEALMGYFLPPLTAALLRLGKSLSFHPGIGFSSSACLVWCARIQPANKGSLQRNMVLFITSHLKSFIWLLNYPQHWTLICFADEKQHLPNSLYCLRYPQPTVKLFWSSSDHFHFMLSLRLSWAPRTSQAGGNCYSGGFLSWRYIGQLPDWSPRLSESAWAQNMRVCCPSSGSHLQDAVGPPYCSPKPSRGLCQCERDFTNAMLGVMLWSLEGLGDQERWCSSIKLVGSCVQFENHISAVSWK